MEEIKAVVQKIIFRNENNYYSIVLANVNGESQVLIGYFPILNFGLTLHCFGQTEMGPKNREQFKVSAYSFELPKYEYHLYHFLTNDYIGLDDWTADYITNHIGISYLRKHGDFDFLETKWSSKEAFEKVEEDLKLASTRLNRLNEKMELMKTMTEMGFAGELSAKISFSDFPLTAKSFLENPYQILFPFDLEWEVVDSIVLKHHIKPTSTIRLEEGVCFVLDMAVKNEGHIYLHRDVTYRKWKWLLKLNLTRDEFIEIEKSLVKQKKIICDVEHHLYGYKYFQAEKNLAIDLYRLASAKKESESFIQQAKEELEKSSFQYSKEQKDIIISVLREPVSIVVGPAGTGKTTILNEIIQLYSSLKAKEKRDSHIFIGAPTGRAAERVKEVTDFPAKTIHSILKINPYSKRSIYNKEDRPLRCDFFIIDESSMVDTILFSQIVNALKDGTKLLIIGDADQLPSIGPGNVLFELIQNKHFPVFELKTVFRQGEGSKILDLATKVRKNKQDIESILTQKSNDLTFVASNNMQEISRAILRVVEIILEKRDIDFYQDFQIITPMHKTIIGTEELNKQIQNLLNQKQKRPSFKLGNKIFYLGDKVMHIKNDTGRKVFNGEIGKVTEINKKSLTVTYPRNKTVKYEGDELFELELGFAISVHKMQGSEANILVFPIHSVFRRMLERRLLYTGITRAKKKLMIIGQSYALQEGITRDTALNRNCNLKQRLEEAAFHNLLV